MVLIDLEGCKEFVAMPICLERLDTHESADVCRAVQPLWWRPQRVRRCSAQGGQVLIEHPVAALRHSVQDHIRHTVHVQLREPEAPDRVIARPKEHRRQPRDPGDQ